ncbi:hypothetical protein E5Q_04235 [Mixia osmundae IAM 14324]|uniref:YABBY protein C-terminal domain-containing protein n=1 Tax=Mixia osmundae (strain CBS 9802 / IAM 14324 / JCM 22182 / KY 12970) TaxID=764103 RepID=G7E3Z7_MIXOS|nr:hypothetical protein E5Q_04235 [Mixia osmundae IAM 14324]
MVAKKKAATGGAIKKRSAYNKYMKGALGRIKDEHPDMAHKERFTLAAQQWKTHPDNPKSKA